MAERYTQQANKAVAPVYGQAQKGINQQTSAVDTLYNALYGGIGTQQDALVQNIVQTANRLGVGRGSLAADTAAQLDPTAQLGQAQLGVQRAQDIAGLKQETGKLQAGQVNGAANLSNSLLSGDLQTQDYNQKVKTSKEQFNLQKLTIERRAELQRLAAQKAAAEAAARAAESAQRKAATQQLKELNLSAAQELRARAGADGKVSPQDYNDVMAAYAQFGGDPNMYHDKFKGFVNKGFAGQEKANTGYNPYYDFRNYHGVISAQNVQTPGF